MYRAKKEQEAVLKLQQEEEEYKLAVRNDASKVARQGFKLTDILTVHSYFCFFSSDNGMLKDFLIYLLISSYPTWIKYNN